MSQILVSKLIANNISRAKSGTLYVIPEPSDFIYYLKRNNKLIFEGMANLDAFPTKNSFLVRKEGKVHFSEIGVTMECVDYVKWFDFLNKKEYYIKKDSL